MSSPERRSILCPNCRKLIGTEERHCPYCGISRPASGLKRLISLFKFNDPVQRIILINAVMYFTTIFLNTRRPGFSMNPLVLFSPDNRSLLLLGATGTLPIDQLHRWWTLVSANYLHGNLLHIFFNMLAFRQLGLVTVKLYGAQRMIILYTLSGITGFWVSYLAGIPFTIGASAAVSGIIGAILYYGKSRGGVFGHNLYKQVGGWAVANFAFGFLVPGINNWAHGGGMIAGALLGFLLGYEEKHRETLWHRYLAAGCVVMTGLALLWALATAVFYRAFS